MTRGKSRIIDTIIIQKMEVGVAKGRQASKPTDFNSNM